MKGLSSGRNKSRASVQSIQATKLPTGRRRAAGIAAACRLAAALAALPATGLAATVSSVWTNSAGNNQWNTAGNWNPAAVPNNGNGGNTYDVTIGSPAGTLLDVTVTIDNLTVQSNGSLGIQDGQSLTIVGGALANNSTITINSNGGGDATVLRLGADTLLNGTGAIMLNATANSTGRAQITTAGTSVLTQAAGSSITGDGQINATLVNNGTVNANVGGSDLFLQTDNMTNNSLFEATGGGRLDISGITVTQGASGQISANNSTVNLSSASIVGGTLATASGGVIQSSSGSNLLTSVTNSGTLNILDNTSVHLSTALTNNGTITINSNGGGDATALTADTSTTLNGSGTVNLNATANSSGRAQLNTAMNATLTQAAGHSITGDGQINAALVNQGLVNANVGGSDLWLQTNDKTNSGTMEATNGGKLDINGITITNAGGTLTAADGSTLHLGNNATISGGILSTTGTGSILTDMGGATTLTGNLTLPTGTGYNIVDNTNTHLASSITNNGTITINSNGGGDATALTADTSLTLSGSGTVNLFAANNSSGRAQLNAPAGAILTVGPTQLVTGNGQINAALTNNGTVNANVPGASLVLQGSDKTNNGLMEATNGSLLDLVGTMTITQSASGQILANGSTVRLLGNVTINGGALNTQNFVPPMGNPVTGVVQNAGGSNTLNNVTIANNGKLDVLDNTALHLTGQSLTDNGTITINANGGGDATLISVDGNLTLAGTGTVNLVAAGNSSGRAQLNTAMNATLTQAAGHSITGLGQINAALVNQGLVDANVSGGALWLQTNNMTNTATMEATGGGALNITGITITNAGGTVTAADGSTLHLGNNATISGGILSSTGSGSITTDLGGATTLTGNLTLPMGTSYNIVDNTNTHLGSSITNNGTITINSNGGGDATALTADTSLTLNGSGTVNLNATANSSGRAQLNTAPGATLTVGPNQMITGDGLINAALTDSGTVNANVGGSDLVLLANNKTNTGTMEATGGGKLDVNGITISNTGGTITAADGSSLHLGNNATISGGVLSSTGTGSITTDLGGATTLTGNVTLPTGTSFNIVDNTNTHLGSSITNNGTITINSNGGGDATGLTADTNLTLNGSGTVNLNATANSSGRAQLNTAPGATVTVGANQVITGDGQINAALLNQGLVNANVGGSDLWLQTNDMTNTGTMEATKGGALDISGITVTNTGGTISAGNGSSVNLRQGAAITGGTLSASGSGVVQNISATNTLTNVTVAAGTPFNILDNSAVNAAGTLTNHGVITVNSNSGGDLTTLAFNSGASLTGDGGLVVNNNGRVTFPKNSPPVNNSLGSLTINGNGKVDLANNGITIDYGANPSPLAAIQSYLSSGALVSSLTDSSHVVALVDSANGGVPGQPPHSLVVEYAIVGDADLEGFVGFDDLVTLARHYGKNNADWSIGDFNNDNTVGFDDLVALARHYGQTLTAAQLAEFDPTFRADVEAAFATVPEPGTVLLFTMGAGAVLPRRRRSRSRSLMNSDRRSSS